MRNKCLREQIATLRGTRNLVVYRILSRLLRPLRVHFNLARRLIPRFLKIVAVYTKKAIINIVLNMPIVVKSSIIDGILRLLF